MTEQLDLALHDLRMRIEIADQLIGTLNEAISAVREVYPLVDFPGGRLLAYQIDEISGATSRFEELLRAR
jgi:hypothetical protein